MKKATLLLLSTVLLVSGIAHGKGLNAEKPIVCSLQSAHGPYLRHQKALVVDNMLYLVRDNGETYQDGRMECSNDGNVLECIGETINLSVLLEDSLGQVDERSATGSHGYFSSACEN